MHSEYLFQMQLRLYSFLTENNSVKSKGIPNLIKLDCDYNIENWQVCIYQ